MSNAESSEGDVISFRSTDELFEKVDIQKIKGVFESSSLESLKTSSQIRDLVAQNYRNLITASDIIVNMGNCANDVVESIHKLPLCLSKMIEYQNKKIINNDSIEEIVTNLPSPVSLILDGYENISSSLNQGEILKATVYYLATQIAKSTSESLFKNSKQQEDGMSINSNFIVSSLISLKQFPSRILSLCDKTIKSIHSSVDTICDAFLSMYLLENLSLSSILANYLSIRLSVFLSKLSLRYVESENVPFTQRQVNTLLLVFRNTCKHIHDVYYGGLESRSNEFIKSLSLLVKIKMPSSFSLKDLSVYFFSILPSSSSSSAPSHSLSIPDLNLSPNELNLMLSRWVNSVKAAIASQSLFLSSVSNANDLADIQRNLVSLSNENIEEWNIISLKILDDKTSKNPTSTSEFHLFDDVFSSSFQKRGNEILEVSFSSILSQTLSSIGETLISLKDMSNIRNLPISENDEGVSFDVSIQIITVFDEDVKKLIEDFYFLIKSGGEKKGEKDSEILEKEIENGLSRVCLSISNHLREKYSSSSDRFILVIVGRISFAFLEKSLMVKEILSENDCVKKDFTEVMESALSKYTQISSSLSFFHIKEYVNLYLSSTNKFKQDREFALCNYGWEEREIVHEEGDNETIALPTLPSFQIMDFLYSIAKEENLVCACILKRNEYDERIISLLSSSCAKHAISSFEALIKSESVEKICENNTLQAILDISVLRLFLIGSQSFVRKNGTTSEIEDFESIQKVLTFFNDKIDPVDMALYEGDLQESISNIHKNSHFVLSNSKTLIKEKSVSHLYNSKRLPRENSFTSSNNNNLHAKIFPNSPVPCSRFSLLPLATIAASPSTKNILGNKSTIEKGAKSKKDEASSIDATKIVSSISGGISSYLSGSRNT